MDPFEMLLKISITIVPYVLIHLRFIDWMNWENESTVTNIDQLFDEGKHNF